MGGDRPSWGGQGSDGGGGGSRPMPPIPRNPACQNEVSIENTVGLGGDKKI